MRLGVTTEGFGELVLLLRTRAGLTQPELARLTGKKQGNTVLAWEKGTVPDLETFPLLAEALRVPEAFLLRVAGLGAADPDAEPDVDPALWEMAERAGRLYHELRTYATTSPAVVGSTTNGGLSEAERVDLTLKMGNERKKVRGRGSRSKSRGAQKPAPKRPPRAGGE